MVRTIFEFANKVNTTLTLSAFAIAILAVLLIYFFTKPSKIKKGALLFFGVLILLLCLIPAFSSYYDNHYTIFRIRVSLVDLNERPIKAATIYSSLGGEIITAPFGWEIQIPKGNVPRDKLLRIFSEESETFLKGDTTLMLDNGSVFSVTIKMFKDENESVGGMIVNHKGQAVFGAKVFIVGYSHEFKLTDTNGSFFLKAHASINEQVRIHVEKDGFLLDTYIPAGRKDFQLQIDGKK